MEPIYLGIDGEMSGTNPSIHSLIQVGVALSLEQSVSSRIGWSQFQYDSRALDAIGVSVDSIRSGPSAEEVDAQLVEWLEVMELKGRKLVPVGWGVSYFDRPYIDLQLPRFSSFLHHHSVELNAVAYAMGGTCLYLGEHQSFDSWKIMAKRIASLSILNERGEDPKEHDALDDAISAILSWRWMRSILASQALELSADCVDSSSRR